MLFINQPDLDIVKQNVLTALHEDIHDEDISAALLAEKQCNAVIIAREPGVLAGIAWANMAFSEIDSRTEIKWAIQDGETFESNQTLCTIEGYANKLVTAERTALNFLQCLSATASKVAALDKLLAASKTKLLDTRKTIPGLRYAQKYAVICGGGINHRMGLYDAFLIKENHIAQAGSITKVIEQARHYKTNCFVEIEVEDLAQCEEALLAAPDRIMLDNFTIDAIQEAMQLRNKLDCNTIQFEASGNINEKNIKDYAATDIEFISLGTLTKDIRAVDLSMRINTP